MRPRKTLHACAAGAIAICCLLSPTLDARFQTGNQPPSIIPKSDDSRGLISAAQATTAGSGTNAAGSSIPDDLWKGDRNRLNNTAPSPGNVPTPTPNPYAQTSSAQTSSGLQPSTEKQATHGSTQSQQTLLQNQQPTSPQSPSSAQPVTQSQSTLRLANQFPSGFGSNGLPSSSNPGSVSQANTTQTNVAQPGSNLSTGGVTTAVYQHTNGSANVVPANHDASRNQSRTLLQPKSKSEDTSKSKSSGGTMQMLISVMSSLAIVIALFFGVAYLYRKSISTTLGKGLPKNVVQVLGRTTIAPRQQLVLVRFGSKLVLVSMLQGEARAISEITDPMEVDQLSGFCESSQTGSISNSFREILTQGVKA